METSTAPAEPAGGPAGDLTALLAADGRRVVVLDDDPTGTQTSHGVDVLLRLDRDALADWFAHGGRGVFALTNTRAMPEEEAVALLARVRRDARELAAARGERVAFVLRGDSTLRGHVFAETGVFGAADAVTLFVPAFPEGGRATLDGVQYLRLDGALRPVAETEFAADPVFGFRSLDIAGWAAERGAPGPVRGVPLADLHREGAAAVRDALLAAPPGALVVPDAVTPADVRTVTAGLLAAEAAGREVVVRSSATLASTRLGTGPRAVATAPVPGAGRVLVVCGSHTAASAEQLAALAELTGPPLEVDTDAVMDGDPLDVARRLAAPLADRLARHGHAVLTSERRRRDEHGGLHHGARVMAALTGTVAAVRDQVDGVVVKGGISSAEVATVGLGARHATVLGQPAPGVALWQVLLPDGRRLPYAVVPGNVGHRGTLAEVFAAFRPEDAAPVRP